MKRSRPIHGVVDSVAADKEIHDAADAVASGHGSQRRRGLLGRLAFPYAERRMVFDPRRTLEPPLAADERRTYETSLDQAKGALASEESAATDMKWRKVRAVAEPSVDQIGKPVLRLQEAESTIEIGLCRENLPDQQRPPQFVQQLLITGLENLLPPGSPSRASQAEVENDWKLLQPSLASGRESMSENSKASALP